MPIVRNISALLWALTLPIASGAQEKAKTDILEQVYLHVNNSQLIVGESLLFSAYVTSVETGKLSDLSKILYVEVLDGEQQPVFQTKISLRNGRGFGDFFINSLFTTGDYHLVAYTRWMKNFGDFFHQPLVIINPFETVPTTTRIHEPKLLFFPEGGQLLAGVDNRVGFRYFNSTGSGSQMTARLLDPEGEKLLDLESDRNGIGSFEFTPEAGQSFQVVMDDGTGAFTFFDVPGSCTACTQLRIRRNRSSFTVRLKASEQVKDNSGFLKIQNAQNTVYEREVFLESATTVDDMNIPSGLFRITLSDLDGKVLNEELYYHDTGKSEGGERTTQPFATRSKVELTIPTEMGSSVSVSAQYLDPAMHSASQKTRQDIVSSLAGYIPDAAYYFRDLTHTDFSNLLLVSDTKWKSIELPGQVALLPEYRNDIISGTVLDSLQQPMSGELVSFAIAGLESQLRIVETDADGRFEVEVVPMIGERDVYLNLPHAPDRQHTIVLDNEFYSELPELPTLPVSYDSVMLASIVRRSVHNQIENAYYTIRQDSVTERASYPPQFPDFRIYNLDDYTKFPEIREVLMEYVPQVGVKKDPNNFDLNMRVFNEPSGTTDRSLVLLDGVPVTTKDMFAYSPYNVEKIEVLDRRYFFGTVAINGILSLRTYDGKLEGFSNKGTKYQYVGLQPQKIYAFPDYEEMEFSKIPDKREQLYWDPIVESDTSGMVNVRFFTSDISGKYSIRLEGVSASGDPIYRTQLIEVE